jgi:hypothetical protein
VSLPKEQCGASIIGSAFFCLSADAGPSCLRLPGIHRLAIPSWNLDLRPQSSVVFTCPAARITRYAWKLLGYALMQAMAAQLQWFGATLHEMTRSLNRWAAAFAGLSASIPCNRLFWIGRIHFRRLEMQCHCEGSKRDFNRSVAMFEESSLGEVPTHIAETMQRVLGSG